MQWLVKHQRPPLNTHWLTYDRLLCYKSLKFCFLVCFNPNTYTFPCSCSSSYISCSSESSSLLILFCSFCSGSWLSWRFSLLQIFIFILLLPSVLLLQTDASCWQKFLQKRCGETRSTSICSPVKTIRQKAGMARKLFPYNALPK